MRILAITLLLIATSNVVAQDFAATEDQRQTVRRLLDQSLQYEIEAIEQSKEEANSNTINSYLPQIELRGRSGNVDQIRRITDAMAKKHEPRRRSNSVTRFNTISNRYENRTATIEGIHELILQGKLNEVSSAVRKSDWGINSYPIEDASSSPQQPKELSMRQLHRFWIACRLACAYHQTGNKTAVRDSLNFARSILEGNSPSGKEFDEDWDWLPEDDAFAGLGPVRQHKNTFHWTLVQSGFAELGIKLFKQEVGSLIARNKEHKNGEQFWSGNLTGHVVYLGFQSHSRLAEFAPLVATNVSPKAASDLVRELFPDQIPLPVNLAMIKASLEQNADDIASWHLQQVIKSIAAPDYATRYHHKQLIDLLVDHQKIAQANHLAETLVERIAKINERLQNDAQASDETPPYAHYHHWAHLAESIVAFNQDAALRLVNMHQNVPAKGEWDNWVEIESVLAKCQKISRARVLNLTGTCFAVDLVDAYLESGQTSNARNVLRDSALITMQNTDSGSSIGDGSNGLIVLDHNARDRIVLAMRAVRLGEFELVRELFAEMPHNYNQREGHRAITREILKHWSYDQALEFIEQTEHKIGKSGAILGLAQEVFPESHDAIVIPRPLIPGC